MNTRRQVIVSFGATLMASGLSGCSSLIGSKHGVLYQKAISLEWDYKGREYKGNPLLVFIDNDKNRKIRGKYDPRMFTKGDINFNNISVSKDLHEMFSNHFRVNYLIGICGSEFTKDDGSSGCRNVWTGRKDFNSAQLNDRIKVQDMNNEFNIINVGDKQSISRTDVSTINFREIHKNHGLDNNSRYSV